MSRTAINPTYKLTIISSTPSKRRDRFGTRRKAKDHSRSCGTAIAMSPTCHETILAYEPLYKFVVSLA